MNNKVLSEICTHLKNGDRDKSFQIKCNKTAIEYLVFHNATEAYVCKEHAKLGRTVENLIVGRTILK